eukprot:tig00000863_g4986.t1
MALKSLGALAEAPQRALRALAPMYRIACCGSKLGDGSNLLSRFDWEEDFRKQLQRLADAEGISSYTDLETERRTLLAYYLKRCETMDEAMSLFEELGTASEKAADRLCTRGSSSAARAASAPTRAERKESVTYRAEDKADSESEIESARSQREVLNEIISNQQLRAKEIELRVANEKYSRALDDLEEARATNERLREELGAVRADLNRLRELQVHSSSSSSVEADKLKKMMQLQGEKYATALKKLSAESAARKQLETQLESTRAELEISKDRILQLTRSISFVAQASSNGIRQSGDDITCLAYHLENLQLKKRVDLLAKGKDDLESYIEKLQMHIKRNRLALERSIRTAIADSKPGSSGGAASASAAEELNLDRTLRLLAENAVFRILWSYDLGEALSELNGFHLPPLKEETPALVLDPTPASSSQAIDVAPILPVETPVESVIEKAIEKGTEGDSAHAEKTPRSQSLQQAFGTKIKHLHTSKKAGVLADKLKNLLVENKDVFI